MTSQDVTSADRQWMSLAIDLARLCPPSERAYSVGAVIVDEDGREISRGYSREDDPHVHAEESALGKLAPDDPRLPHATIYSWSRAPSASRAPGPVPSSSWRQVSPGCSPRRASRACSSP